ncbi:MAG: hypothetical protein IJR99_02895 [Kiritimatiellae bacterium]|nr:hypothetical protein [Kiritimatiellia bacterium]
MKRETQMKLIAAASSLLAFVSVAAVKTATPFADNMVLQRDRPVPVWGTASPGEKVTVFFAGQTKTATADAKGAWRVALDAMPASKESRTLKVTGTTDGEELKNVLVGEVWFASGQSNMECPIWGHSPRYRDAKGAIMTAVTRRPFIRYAKNGRNCSRTPRYDWKAVWRDYSPESFQATFGYNLSAVAFYYALELYSALEIPVGIIDSSWGGTRIEPWTPASAFETAPVLPEKVGSGTPTSLWNGMVAAWAPFAIRGFIWYQGCANAGDGLSYSTKMHRLYDGWAKEFENPNLKLYFVQLAPFSRSWFSVQMGQAKFAAEEKNAAIVTTCDIGNPWDIHPNDKETVAKRLALHALKRDYGFKYFIDDSPTLKNWKIDGNKFVLSFDNAKSWYAYNADRSSAVGFEIAGRDGKFVPAKIENSGANMTLKGSDLVISASGVAEPRRLRYLYSKPWIGSLYSFESGLPLGPFEIDARDPSEGRRGPAAKLGDALKIPELEGFRAVLAADIPMSRFAGYSLDKSADAGAFSRVAYVLELERADGSVDWAVAAMDAFTNDVAKLGVPAASKAFIQQKVSNLVVRSNRECVKEGPAPAGGIIEFFNTNYGQKKGLRDASGSDAIYDSNDSATPSDKPGYGCMQVHDAATGATIFAYNRFNDGSPDIGIGNNVEGENPDWTFMGNASDYRARRLTILVK